LSLFDVMISSHR